MSISVLLSCLGGSQPWRLMPLKHLGLQLSWVLHTAQSLCLHNQSFLFSSVTSWNLLPSYLYFPLTRIFQLPLHWENSIIWESSLLPFTKPTHLHIFALILPFMTTQETSLSKSKIHLPAHAMHPIHSSILGPFLSLTLLDFLLFSFNGSSTITTSLTVSITLK